MVHFGAWLAFCGLTGAAGRYAGVTYHFEFERGWEAGIVVSIGMSLVWLLGSFATPQPANDSWFDSTLVLYLCTALVMVAGLIGTLAGVWEYCQNNGGNMYPKFLRTKSIGKAQKTKKKL